MVAALGKGDAMLVSRLILDWDRISVTEGAPE